MKFLNLMKYEALAGKQVLHLRVEIIFSSLPTPVGMEKGQG
jgi:hypothetical protein